ncbi:SU10 major capsid protein [Enterobacter cloacae]|uniref:SU10 major capsid protein n=1 Tax=Enterobacter cloacae TaxID=550 RepID=UPI003EE2F855
MATELNSYELNGVKDSIADWISNISPSDFPFSSMIGKDSCTQPKFEWQTDSDETVDADNALMEGFEFSDLDDTFAATVPMAGYCQKMGKAVKVTGDADAQSAWGRGKESDYQATKKARALKRDLEYALLNNGATAAEVKGVSPRKLGGYQSLISSTDGGATIKGDPLTGTVTLITSASAQPTAEDIFAAMAALWTTGGKPEVLMVSETMTSVISGMQEGENKKRVFENTPEFSIEVNTITDALGQTVKVIYNRNMPANTVYIFNPDDWALVMFRAPQTEVQGKSGDYIRSVLHLDAGQRHRNPWASAAVLPKPAA